MVMRDSLQTPTELPPLGRLLFLDRYALKAPAELDNVFPGDFVFAHQKEGTPCVGEIMEVADVSARLRLADGSTVHCDLRLCEKLLETAPAQMWSRIARAAAATESPPALGMWAARFTSLLADWKVVPGGRILFGAGTRLPCNNCHVIPSPHDSRAGIMKALGEMTELMSHGAGVGINLSSLRPRGALVRGVNGRTSGPVSWGELFSLTTRLVEEGGSRRGALMLVLDVWHPDVLEFVRAKKNMNRFNYANISIAIGDDFMDAVRADGPWLLCYPNLNNPRYDAEWNGDLRQWRDAGGDVRTYQEVRARDVWNEITHSAWESAEPGLFFSDRYNCYSNSWYYAPIRCTNPCAEQGLPPWGACNLAAVNLPYFISGNSYDRQALAEAVHDSVRLLDNLIDASTYPIAAAREQQLKERRVGLGTMGLAELLIRLGIRYGSDTCLSIVEDIFRTIAIEAYTASIELAREKGPFPLFDRQKYLESQFVTRMPSYIRDGIVAHGIRNVTLLSQAPTGTIATMVGTSTGIEPYYAWEVDRRSRLGTLRETARVVTEYQNANGGRSDDLPPYFVTAAELDPTDHVRVQAVVQRWIDAAVAKTCNLPASCKPEQVTAIYELMYDLGCKGGTVFRDGSRDQQVLCAINARAVCE